jgi:hypothetical protein
MKIAAQHGCLTTLNFRAILRISRLPTLSDPGLAAAFARWPASR